MINAKVAEAFNRQINRELFSAYFYLGLSAYSESLGLRGVASWFMAKHREEMTHGLKLYGYLIDQGAGITLLPVDAPPPDYAGVLDAFEKTLEHERSVTRAIHELVDVARDERDHASEIFLHWFVTEQIEEEAVVNDILSRLRLVGAHGEGLFLIDNELEKLAASATAAGQSSQTA
jgi:ferritin